MGRIKKRWDIVKNWQYLFPVLGFLMTLATAYYIARRFLHLFDLNNTLWEWPFTASITLLGYFIAIRFFLWCFEKLKNKWVTTYRWEMIAIFIVFAITGSLSAKLAAPLLDMLGVNSENLNAWAYWPLRIFIILPIYQILLVFVGWCFGQFQFFWNFEKKMLRRMGFGFLLK